MNLPLHRDQSPSSWPLAWATVTGTANSACHPFRGRLMSTSESWGVNGHTMQCTSPVSVVVQLRLVSGEGLLNGDQRRPMGPWGSGGRMSNVLRWLSGGDHIYCMMLFVGVNSEDITGQRWGGGPEECAETTAVWNTITLGTTSTLCVVLAWTHSNAVPELFYISTLFHQMTAQYLYSM